MAYHKPFLSYPALLKKLEDRGCAIPDRQRALRVLGSAGYYHLTGYLYAVRVRTSAPDGTVSVLNEYEPGTTFKFLENLWRFDSQLRALWLEALLDVEVGVRAAVAHTLGAATPMGHLRAEALDPARCRRVPKRGLAAGRDRTQHDLWLARYHHLQEQASGEAYVRHNLDAYGELPIWIAVEFLDFGAVSKLFELMRHSQREQVAGMLKVPDETICTSWVRQLNYVRNVCAHSSRVWNRVMTTKPTGVEVGVTAPRLDHLEAVPADKIYFPLATTAHLLRTLHPDTDWHRRVATLILTFPVLNAHNPQNDMGFPAAWDTEPLWFE